MADGSFRGLAGHVSAEFGTAGAFVAGPGGPGDVDGVDEGGAVVDLEPVVVADEPDLDAGPALVDVELDAGVAEHAGGVDQALVAAGRVGVGGGEFGGGQVDAGVGDVDLGGEALADGLVRPGVVVVVPVGVQEFLGGGQRTRPRVVSDPLVLGVVLALEFADGLGVAGAGVDQLGARGGDLPFERDGGADQPAGEVDPVVGDQLPGQPARGDGAAEGFPARPHR